MSCEFREIIAKTVVGKARKFVQAQYTLTPPDVCEKSTAPVSCILGVWAVNTVEDDDCHHGAPHSEDNEKKGKRRQHPTVKGNQVFIPYQFNVSAWYSYDNNTKTNTVQCEFKGYDVVDIDFNEDDIIGTELDVQIRVVQHPHASQATIVDSNETKCGEICVVVEREYVVEVIGQTKVCVQVFPGACNDDEPDVQREAEFEAEDDDCAIDINPDTVITEE